MEKKYELTDETTDIVSCHTLYRIRALRDFDDVKAGDLGGFIENESNLSHDGNCWVYDNACVTWGSKIYDNAKIYNNARVYGGGRIFENAQIYGNAIVYPNARIYGDAKIYGDSEICGESRITTNEKK
ncbi:hypothetical protein BHOIPH791_06690 [Bartonella henselae]|uniref:Phage related protein n=2 Tax=Bartonella TaxID=773 RepID=A0A0G2Q8J9_BARHE|nr:MULTISPECIES: hypothetical protein [Bartonella]ATP12447.1 hypothetical protein BhenCHDE101_04670 [Bartonella henselae]ETS04115.1 hypothetical protein Q655_01641 [Bartonella henselae JK 51]KEC54866.1 hypothetical protein O9A_01057 [Bartonella koehlerae C-29]MDM9991538.1 hypothetical protein [Bartonella henselae]OLL56778.1 hypothetical protein AT246_07880 [Bartonella henselae]